ncbi:MAG: helix-turn-helix transcriptional regulator [Thermoplasmata archaeon]|nr:helix-turn-helix transcriptional regulator [Thermoplasmata archaeon]
MRCRRDPDLVVRDVGRRVAELRAQRGLTQAAFSEVIGLSVTHLRKIELGELNMTIHSLVRLADHLDVGIGELFEPPKSRAVRRGRPRRTTGT